MERLILQTEKLLWRKLELESVQVASPQILQNHC